MQLQKANRQKAKIKLAIQGQSGGGKTYSALLLAYGLCNDYSKVAVIDTENHSANLYAHLGSYNVLNIGQPFSPEKYMEAIKLCEDSGMEVIIIDSISHEWDSIGGILDIHGNMAGNSFTNWAKVTPRHNSFVQALLQSPCHIVGTIRSKQDYVLSERNGKVVPEKIGLKGVTKDGLDYEFTIVFTIDSKHNVSVSKDRTGLFVDKPEFIITKETGKAILDWCNSGNEVEKALEQQPVDEATLFAKMDACITYEELLALYKENPTDHAVYIKEFRERSVPLLQPTTSGISNNLNFSSNGTTTHK